MARRGRKPKPTAIKILDGTRGDRINRDEPSPAAGRPECPGHLDDVGRAEWERIVPQLEQLGVLTRVDGAALSLYCGAFAEMLAAEAAVREYGQLIQTGQGGRKANPAVAIARQARGQVHRLLVEFGLTPSSRSRLQASSHEQPKDALEEFLSRKKAR
jgi:P27 family predicted phage terminase small subunit